jgi:hypothetical protein
MRPLGQAWKAQLSEWRIPCPEGLVALADAAAECLLELGGWQFYAPEGAGENRGFLQRHAALMAHAQMAPLFGRDGDLLLLAGDGRIHLWRHEAWEDSRVVAGSFRELLAAIAAFIDPARLEASS